MSYFRFSSMQPDEIQGDITLPYNPKWRMGVHTDVDGKKWHINGYMHGCALAQPLTTTSRMYTSTETNLYGYFSDTWRPYRIKYIEASKND